MKKIYKILSVLLVCFAVLSFSGAVSPVRANFLKKAYKKAKKTAKKIVHKGEKLVKKGKKILRKGKVIGESIGRGYILIGKKLYKADKRIAKGAFKIGKTFYKLEVNGAKIIGKRIFYNGLFVGKVIGKGIITIDGIVYHAVTAPVRGVEYVVIKGIKYAKGTSKPKIDLSIGKIYLSRDCKVNVEVRNTGKSNISKVVWVTKAKRSKLMLKVNGKSWGGVMLPMLDRSAALLKRGGKAVYKSNLKISGPTNITATVDENNVIKEINERNNRRTQKLTCRKRVVNTKLPDLAIDRISLDRKCNVVVKVRNLGKAGIPMSVYRDKKPNSASVYLKVNGRNWGGGTIWAFDSSKKLLRRGGSVTYKSRLKVKGTQNITAVVDMTRQIKESNERNNAKTQKLTCKKSVTIRPIGKKPIMRRVKPDLVVKDIKVTRGCGILVTVANISKFGIPNSGYNMSNGVGIQMYNGNKPWGGIRLAAVDRRKKLSKGKGIVSFVWFPGAKNLKLHSGKNRIKVVIDNNNAVKESNENNNIKMKTLMCKRKITIKPIRKKPVMAIGKPDLIITSFGLKRWGACKPNSAVMTFAVTIKNIGNAPTPNIGRKALVQVMDQDGSGWGNGAFVGVLKPNQSKTVLIPVYYLKSNPKHMTDKAPHPFVAIADPLRLIKESNEANNRTRALRMGAPKGCNNIEHFVKPAKGIVGKIPTLKIQKPDLVVKSLSFDKRCNIVVKIANIGHGGVKNSAYLIPDKNFIVLHDGTQLLGGISLLDADHGKKLKTPNTILTSTWNPGNFNRTMPNHTIKAVIDYGKIVSESNENNNYKVVRLKCKRSGIKKIGKLGVSIPKSNSSKNSSPVQIQKNVPTRVNKVMPNEPVEAPKQIQHQGAMH